MRGGGQLLLVGPVQLVEQLRLERGDPPCQIRGRVGDLRRGPVAHGADLVLGMEQALLGQVAVHELRREVPQLGIRQQRLPALGNRGGQVATAVQDRKSTRLNSSHVAISYAVFCLKKKITKRVY